MRVDGCSPPATLRTRRQADVDLAFFQVARQRLRLYQHFPLSVGGLKFLLQGIDLLTKCRALVLRQTADRAKQLAHRASTAQILAAPGRQRTVLTNVFQTAQSDLAQLIN